MNTVVLNLLLYLSEYICACFCVKMFAYLLNYKCKKSNILGVALQILFDHHYHHHGRMKDIQVN